MLGRSPAVDAGALVPTVALIDGVKVIFDWNDHLPPYVYVVYAEHRALISQESFEVLEGALPRLKLTSVLIWAARHHKELVECWDKAQTNEHPRKVE